MRFVILMLLSAAALSDPAPCAGDLNGDGQVNFADLAIVRTEMFRTDCETSCPAGLAKGYKVCFADVNMDYVVNLADMQIVRSEFGRVDCPRMICDTVIVRVEPGERTKNGSK